MQLQDKISAAAEYVLNKVSFRPTVALVLGSGLGDYADTLGPCLFMTGDTIKKAYFLLFSCFSFILLTVPRLCLALRYAVPLL